MTETPSARSPRLMIVDVLRGAAIVAMIGYHALWDATLFGFVGTEIILSPAAKAVQVCILGSFLLLVGASLALATRNGIAWAKAGRRLALVAGGALLITIATVWLFPETYVFFGVLHAVALFSLIGLLALRLPDWLLAAAGAAIVAPPLLWTDPLFTNRWLAWIGFYPESPPTNDLVPIFPWLGVVLLGLAGMRTLMAAGAVARAADWRPASRLWRGLALAGRWSLLIYLLHQPLLLGVFYPLSMMRQTVPVDTRAEGFGRACTASCEENNTLGYCERYCSCAVAEIAGADLWDAAAATAPTPEQRQSVLAVTGFCAAMADPVDATAD